MGPDNSFRVRVIKARRVFRARATFNEHVVQRLFVVPVKTTITPGRVSFTRPLGDTTPLSDAIIPAERRATNFRENIIGKLNGARRV